MDFIEKLWIIWYSQEASNTRWTLTIQLTTLKISIPKKHWSPIRDVILVISKPKIWYETMWGHMEEPILNTRAFLQFISRNRVALPDIQIVCRKRTPCMCGQLLCTISVCMAATHWTKSYRMLWHPFLQKWLSTKSDITTWSGLHPEAHTLSLTFV